MLGTVVSRDSGLIEDFALRKFRKWGLSLELLLSKEMPAQAALGIARSIACQRAVFDLRAQPPVNTLPAAVFLDKKVQEIVEKKLELKFDNALSLLMLRALQAGGTGIHSLGGHAHSGLPQLHVPDAQRLQEGHAGENTATPKARATPDSGASGTSPRHSHKRAAEGAGECLHPKRNCRKAAESSHTHMSIFLAENYTCRAKRPNRRTNGEKTANRWGYRILAHRW
jgi:hypothetical protein